MPVASSTTTTKKVSSPAVGRRSSSVIKGVSRSGRPPSRQTAQSLRSSNASQQTSRSGLSKKTVTTMNDNFLAPPRPPDPKLFVRAGTSGLRHLFPIHLTNNNDSNREVFSRSISRLRSRTPTTELCTNIEMIRNVCLSIKTLQHFDVSNNDLNELPLDISLLTDLETLNCSNNQLSDIAELFEQLKRLKELDISYNRFKTLPNVIYTYKYLVRLNCEQNSITTIGSQITNLKRLKYLILDNNQLQTTESIDFGQMKKLEYIQMANNQLIKFPSGLHLLHHLKSVNLSYNRLKSFPVDLLLVNTLDVLNLSHNCITKLPALPVTYSRASLIFSIDLSYNELTKFYDYLLLIAIKVDVSNNKIRMISNELIKKLNNDIISTRELKIYNNPLTQPAIPSEMLTEDVSNTVNVLRMIRNCFDDQQIDAHVRQGFKICVVGPKRSGKTSLATCLEENIPINIEEDIESSQERIVHVHQYPIRLLAMSDPLSTSTTAAAVTTTTTTITIVPTTPTSAVPPSPSFLMKSPFAPNTKTVELPKIQLQRFEMDTRKRRNPSAQTPKQNITVLNQPQLPIPVPVTPVTPLVRPAIQPEPIKYLPITLFDLNGSSKYYEHVSPFLDTSALYLMCINTVEFYETVPASIEDLFNGNFDINSSKMITELFELLQLLCEKVTKTHAIMILPIASFMDLYDTRPKEDQVNALEKIDNFFKLYLQHRNDRIKREIDSIHSLQTISSSLSDRLKIYTTLLNVSIQIEPCQTVSSVSYDGIEDLNRTIQRLVLTQKSIFPNVDRILPSLWAEANQYIESLADILPAPYILWENFTDRVIGRHGLPHLINDITMSLNDEGKILVINEIGTSDRIVFLRPSWLADLLYCLFRQDMTTTYLDFEKNEIFALANLSEPMVNTYKKEFIQGGLLHSDLLYALWCGLLHKKEHLYHLWLALMRFLLIAYPKISKAQLKHALHVQTPDPYSKPEKKLERLIDVKQNPEVREEIKFDYAIVPYYLPFINEAELSTETENFTKALKNIIIIRYTSTSLPIGVFHRFSVSAILRLHIIYKKHYNNCIIGGHEEKDVRFLMETDHRTYITCRCGTSMPEQPFEEIWNVLMPMLNQMEALLACLTPSNHFERSVQCVHCKEFSFMGEWTTPKELQCLKTKACTLCSQHVDTARLVQPNESKRRSEELLRRIRERHSKTATKEPIDIPPTTPTAITTAAATTTPTPQLLVTPV